MTDQDQYSESLSRFDAVISSATAVSQGAAGRISSSSRHYYASVLFTRLCTNGVSLLCLAPGNRLVWSAVSHWDFAAVASLTRNLMECYLTFFYLSVDEVAEDEWNCRWNIFNLHDCLRRRKMFDGFGSTEEELMRFDAGAEELRARLRDNPHFCSLGSRAQAEFLNAKNAYLLTQDDLVRRVGLDAGLFRGLYIFLSSQTHSYPLGFYRTGEGDRGRGLENRVEKEYIAWMLGIAAFFVRRATREMVVLFPNADCDLSAAEREAIFHVDAEAVGVFRAI